jgi:hypothetical protein
MVTTHVVLLVTTSFSTPPTTNTIYPYTTNTYPYTPPITNATPPYTHQQQIPSIPTPPTTNATPPYTHQQQTPSIPTVPTKNTYPYTSNNKYLSLHLQQQATRDIIKTGTSTTEGTGTGATPCSN